YSCINVHYFFFFSSRRRHTRFSRDWSSDVCSSDLTPAPDGAAVDDDAAAPPALAWSSSRTSLVAFLNSRTARPTALPTSGSLPGPKIMSAKIKMTTSSIAPMPNMTPLPLLPGSPSNRLPFEPVSLRTGFPSNRLAAVPALPLVGPPDRQLSDSSARTRRPRTGRRNLNSLEAPARQTGRNTLGLPPHGPAAF